MNKKKLILRIVIIVAFVLAIFVYFKYYFVYSEGTKAGLLNTFQLKGVVFKTWEGKVIQSGFRANVQSNEFDFSVTNESVAQQLLRCSGKEVELHYKRYMGVLPWRGLERNIVDSVYEIRSATIPESVIAPK
jgi:hypothetical protein